jgi:hypothetical protein
MKMGLQEFTSDNFVLALLGTKAEASGSPIAISIGTNNQIVGAIRFLGQNDIGPRQQLDLPSVLISPSAALNLLADDWGVIELSGDVRGDPTTGSYGTHYPNIVAEVTP